MAQQKRIENQLENFELGPAVATTTTATASEQPPPITTTEAPQPARTTTEAPQLARAAREAGGTAVATATSAEDDEYEEGNEKLHGVFGYHKGQMDYKNFPPLTDPDIKTLLDRLVVIVNDADHFYNKECIRILTNIRGWHPWSQAEQASIEYSAELEDDDDDDDYPLITD